MACKELLEVHNSISVIFASADIDDLHLDVFLGDADGDIVVCGREIVAFDGSFVQRLSQFQPL